jgi:hypothetical protein
LGKNTFPNDVYLKIGFSRKNAILHIFRGGLAPQINFGRIFIRGAPKKKKKCCWLKNKKKKHYKGAIAAAQTGSSHELKWSQKKKKRSWCWEAPDCHRDPQTRGAPWDFSHLVIWPVRPCTSLHEKKVLCVQKL